MRSRSIALLLTTLSVLLLCSGSVYGKKRSKSKEPTEQAAKEPTTYEKLFEDKQTKTAKGFLTLHMVEGELIMELPKQYAGKDMLIGSTIEQTSSPEWGYAGLAPEKPLHVRFTATDSLVLVHYMKPSMLATGEANVQQAIDKSNIWPVIAAFPIECPNPDSTAWVFKATSLFVGDNKYLLPRDQRGSGSFGGLVQVDLSYNGSKSMLCDVASYGDNVSISSLLSFGMSYETFFGTSDSDPGDVMTAVAKRSIMLLPEQMARPRLADMRIGTVNSDFTEMDPGQQGAKRVFYANRWDLAPSDSTGTARSIVFYLDPMMPEFMVPYVKRGIEKWNEPLEEAGHPGAIRVLPYPENDDSFDPDNIEFSCIKFAPSIAGNVRSTVWSDPRSGEIFSASIYIPYNALSEIYTEMLIYLGGTVPAIREKNFKQELVLQGLEALVAKEMARCLGLAPNYAGSYAFPTDSLRSAEFTRKYGISASITDELPYNFVAREADVRQGAALMQSEPGVYDVYALKWLYGRVEGAQTPEDEALALEEMIKQKEGDPMYLYTSRQINFSLDPRTRTGDLGRDPIESFKAYKANVGYCVSNYDKWIAPQDKDLSYRLILNGGTLMNTLDQFFNLLVNVGGIYINEKYEGDPQASYVSVPGQLQRDCWRFVLEEIKDISWIDNKEFIKDVYFVVSGGDYIQSIMTSEPYGRLSYMDLSAAKSTEKSPYTMREAFEDLFRSVTKDVRDGKLSAVSTSAINMQSTLLSYLAYYGNVIDPPSRDLTGSTAGRGRDGVNGLGSFGGFGGFTPMPGIEFNVPSNDDDILYGYFMDLKALYEKALARTTDKKLAVQYKFMLMVIDKALEID